MGEQSRFILARPVGRALLKTCSLGKGLVCFNPRPSCGTGATIKAERDQYLSNVSILARPVGRALRVGAGVASTTHCSFNPRPSCGTGATTNIWLTTQGDKMFQSSPVLWDGRYFIIRNF